MHETNTCRHCHKPITQYRSGWWSWNSGIAKSTNYCPNGLTQHAPVGDGADGRPAGPYVLHLGVILFSDVPEQIPADTLGPDFATDGDSWNQWGEPFDGTQRVTVALDAMPDDPDEHAVETARALAALLGIRGVSGRVGDYASYTQGDDGDRSQWEVVVATCSA